MDQERTVDTGRLREAMDTTRASIRDTVEELREKVGDTVDWRHYVDRYPGATLTLAVAIGMFVGRQIGTMIHGHANGFGRLAAHPVNAGGGPEFTSAPAHLAAGYEAAARPIEDRMGSWKRTGAVRSLGASCSRVGSRLESLLNRVIDEIGDTAERTLVPALITRVQGFFDSGDWFGRRHGTRGTEAIERGDAEAGRRADSRWRREEPAERRLEPGVYPERRPS